MNKNEGANFVFLAKIKYRMIYNEFQPHQDLIDYIDTFWTVEGTTDLLRKERILPDGCVDLILNLGESCLTDNGKVIMESGKAYLVGTMTTSQQSLLDSQHRLMGIRFKPGAFSSFFNYAPLHEIVDKTIELEKVFSPDFNKLLKDPISYLNGYLLDKVNHYKHPLTSIIKDIQKAGGQISIDELSKRNCITGRQLERSFKKYIGISPKEFVNIVRFQFALEKIKCNKENRSFLDIAFESGYYDHSHLTNEIKRYTGLVPSQF